MNSLTSKSSTFSTNLASRERTKRLKARRIVTITLILKTRRKTSTMTMATKTLERTARRMKTSSSSRKLISWMKMSTNSATRCSSLANPLVRSGSQASSYYRMKRLFHRP